LDELVLVYNNTLARLLDKHAPVIHKRVSSQPPSPWFTLLLSCLKATCRRYERAWRSSKTTFNLLRLRHATNLYHHTIIKSKKSYHANLVNDSKSHPANCGKLSTIFFTCRKAPRSLPSTISEPLITSYSTFSSFFADKIAKLHSSLTSKNSAVSIRHSDPPCTPKPFNSFRLVTIY